jgi:hypothetical protein
LTLFVRTLIYSSTLWVATIAPCSCPCGACAAIVLVGLFIFLQEQKQITKKTQFLATPFTKSMTQNGLARMARSLYLDTLFELVSPITRQPQRVIVPNAGVDILHRDGFVNQTARPRFTHYPNPIDTATRHDSHGFACDYEQFSRVTSI